MDHYEDQGISLADIWDKLWANKYLILIITSIITLVFGISSYYLLKGSQVTETGFEYNFMGVTQNQYPDGSLFEFRNLLSYDKLLSVQSSSDLFADIDVEAMYLDNNTRIVRQKNVNSTASDVEYSNNRYTLYIPNQYFNYDFNVAESFIMTLIESIIEEAREKNQDLEIFNYIDLINDSVEYFDMVDYFSSQYHLVIDSISNFISIYGDVTFQGTNITNMKELLQFEYANGYSFSDLQTIIRTNLYYRNSTLYLNRLNVKIDALQETVELNSLRIAELEATYNNLVTTSNLQQANQILIDIVTYRIANVDANYQISLYQEVIDQALASGMTSNTSPEFELSINNMQQLIDDYTDQYNNFYLSYINQDTRVVYDLGSVLTINGGYSIIVTGVVSGILGLFISLVVVFIKESETNKKALKEN